MPEKGSYKNKRFKNNTLTVGEIGREVLENIDESNPTVIMFRQYAAELDEKHDRHERIVKLSRDITIESKRIIFLLHGSNVDLESKRESTLNEAEKRLGSLLKSFKLIALELKDIDGYQYLRAFTSGLQEYVEAVALYQYIRFKTVKSWEEILQNFKFTVDTVSDESQTVELLFPTLEFILGIADFTGEMMRKCINCLGSGNIDECFQICNFVKLIYTGFLGINGSFSREFRNKMYVLHQSLLKMENVCYNITVRGSEIPKHMLAEISFGQITEQNEDTNGAYF